ncbi:MAG: glucose-1-phosphate thymidylyltransferase [Bacteroidia bacterium]|nr:MAG: glucose-1-phosphate thymidylyltransferase [Bacteroidia bacterium]
MNYILFDDATRADLLPLVFMRPVADIRVGILTIREKWEYLLKVKTSTMTEAYLAKKYPIVQAADNNVLINGSVCPTQDMIQAVANLKVNEALVTEDYIIALNVGANVSGEVDIESGDNVLFDKPHIKIKNVQDIFGFNAEAIQSDFSMLTKGRSSQTLSDSNRVVGDRSLVFLEEGAKAECATFNTTEGPIYIGKDAEVMENASIRGPFALGTSGVVKMAAKIYGGTTIGPWAKVAGEVNNSVIFGYSNKAHDGFLGNSVIAEWCNLGSDTNTSNLKNTYEEVRLWNYPTASFVKTGLTFCGLIMADHSKCGINTMFNTGTVVGVSCNIYGSGFHRNFISSFKWCSTAHVDEYDIEKAISVAEIAYGRRQKTFDEVEEAIFREVYAITRKNKLY